jgi:hypothetical protein
MNEPYVNNQGLLELNPYERATFELFSAETKKRISSLENYIQTVGSHPKISEEAKKRDNLTEEEKKYINSFLPARPHREDVIRQYVRMHKPRNRTQRKTLLSRAEQDGTIERIMNQEYKDRLLYKVSLIMKVANPVLVDVDALGKGDEFDQDFDGVTFRG